MEVQNSAEAIGHFQAAIAVGPIIDQSSSALASLLGLAATDFDKPVLDRAAEARLGLYCSLFRALRVKHPPTAKHCLRTSLACAHFARALNFEPARQGNLEVAALLHDLGKIGVPENLLNKPSRLDADEIAVMDRHRRFGLEILEGSCGDPEILEIVRHASTWFDGTRPSYCEVKGSDLPLGARMLAIVDAFDSMTTDVVYRRALPVERAVRELRDNSPGQFDPELVELFAALFSRDKSQVSWTLTRNWVETTLANTDGMWRLQTPGISGSASVDAVFQKNLLEVMHDGVAFVDVTGEILVWNRGAELLTGISKESIHHKTWDPAILDLRDTEGNATRPQTCPIVHCLRTFAPSQHRMTVTNQHGDRIAVNLRVVPVMHDGGQCHGATVFLQDASPQASLEEQMLDLHQIATCDALTGVNNRAEFDRRHIQLIREHTGSGRPFSLIICDIDRFKGINDVYGHQAGDQALIEFARLIKQHRRGNDVVARYGGEEFVIMCPDCDQTVACRKAEVIRRELQNLPLSVLNGNNMTASFGVTELQPGDTPETMLRRADRALYEAKESGRNRVIHIGGDARPEDKQQKGSWWANWGMGGQPEPLIERTLVARVPVNLIAEKLRGFISDHGAKILQTTRDSVSICLDERNIPLQRRQSDRPSSMTVELEFREATNPVSGTETTIDVVIRPRRSRDRRKDVILRADQLLASLRSYLVADEVLVGE